MGYLGALIISLVVRKLLFLRKFFFLVENEGRLKFHMRVIIKRGFRSDFDTILR